MNIGILHSVWTVLVLILFVGIVAWALSSFKKADFEEAARLPFDEEDDIQDEDKSSSGE